MDRTELFGSIHDQAEVALTYLEFTRLVELGDEDIPHRNLTKFEDDVKESALACLLSYFVKDLEFCPPKSKNVSTIKVSENAKTKLNTNKKKVKHGQR